MMLENLQHDFSVFVTLTYSPENLPENRTLVPRDVTLWLKRLRKELEPRLIRYYVCGEYGNRTQRPHYHAILFGVSILEMELIQKTWPHGYIHVGEVTLQSCAYVAGYVTKAMTKDDDERLKGRHPEFARMSTKPGLGAKDIGPLVDVLTSKFGSISITESGDVPESLRIGGRDWPIGKYIRRKLREALDFADTKPQGKRKEEYEKRLHELQELYGPAAYASAKPYVDWVRMKKREMNLATFPKERPL